MNLKGIVLIAFVVWLAVPAPLRAGHEAGHTVSIERVVSPAGVTAWLVRDTINPIVNVRFAFRGGAALDPVGKDGLANMVSGLLDEGAGDLDSQTFQRRLEDLSIELRFNAGRDAFSGRLKTLSENKDQAFHLLKVALLEPRFDDTPVKRIRGQILAGLRRDQEDPDTIAGQTLARELFPDHPYGRRVEGSMATVKAITSDDLRAFTRQRLARDNLVIAVVGDMDAAELGRFLDEVFAGLPAKSQGFSVKDIQPQTAGRTKVVKMDIPQSAIAFAQKGLKRSDPDFYAAYVLNHILGGGGFTSRLYEQIREKRGLAYSIGSYLYPLDHAGLVQGYGGTANARVGETLEVLKDQWRTMAETGVTPEELADAKTYLIGSYPLRFTSTGGIASILVSMQLEKLGIDFLDRRNTLVEAVNLKDVNRLAKKLLDPDNMVVVVVGAPEGVTSTP
ncbi:MAG: insulinase family protein [Rhodospirillaceae bacterium]|nr:insulinase family protein [Rhodospirillaceae bacterium]MBL6942381.1 insulinase family protein [Rhodospirillales bacterium]